MLSLIIASNTDSNVEVFPGNQLYSLFFPSHPGSSAGKKRAWVPDEKEAYIEIEIKERSGDKVVVETKDGKVGIKSCKLKTKKTKTKKSHFGLHED